MHAYVLTDRQMRFSARYTIPEQEFNKITENLSWF